MPAKFITEEKPPVIIFSKKADRKMKYVVDKVPTEVGWMGTVEKTVDPITNVETYKITDIFVPYQHVAAATCEIKPKGREELAFKLMDSVEDEEEGQKLAESLLFWGHSHVNMGTSPSGQDEKMVFDYKNREYFIRGIFNKQGSVTLDLFKFKDNVQWTGLEPVYEDEEPTEEEKAELDKCIEENLEPKDSAWSSKSSYGRNYGSYFDYNTKAKTYWEGSNSDFNSELLKDYFPYDY